MARQYATYDDLVKRYPVDDIRQLSLRGDEGFEVDLTAVNTALVDATAEIDEYVGTRYKLPLTVIGLSLIEFACIIARYKMEYGERTKTAIYDYQRTIKRLEELRDGIATLGLSKDDLLPEVASGGIVIESDKPVWSRKDSKGFI